jgi:hypothetical protein
VAGPPKDDDDDGDFSIQLNPYPVKPVGPTMELQTSDLANMAQSGVASAKPNLMIQLDTGETVELGPGWSQERGGRGSEPPPSIIVELHPETHVPAPLPRPPPVAAPREPRSPGVALVVIVYVIASVALGLAIYERFVA